MKRARARVIVSGRVQGVWFRESTRRRASELGLSGWVRNLPDGRVEAEFEGEADAVEAALGFVAEGPTHARVDSVDVEEREDLGMATPQPREPFHVR
jgi:acylphosphatase